MGDGVGLDHDHALGPEQVLIPEALEADALDALRRPDVRRIRHALGFHEDRAVASRVPDVANGNLEPVRPGSQPFGSGLHPDGETVVAELVYQAAAAAESVITVQLGIQ